MAEETDNSESLHLFCVNLEGCDSVSERGVNELFSIKIMRSGTTLDLR